MMESKGSAPQSQKRIVRILSFISVGSCVLCLLLAAITLVVLLCYKTRPMEEGKESSQEALKNSCITGSTIEDITSSLMKLPQTMKTTVAHLQLAKRVNTSAKMIWNSDRILKNVDYHAGDLVIKTPGLYFAYCHLHFKTNCLNRGPDLMISLHVNGESRHQTLHTHCKQEHLHKKAYTGHFFGAVFDLKTKDNVSVVTNEADCVDKDTLIKDNVFGLFILH
ncbi:tumor necrosis factor ligand superfamily member 8 [Ambystoma mexicanum]|uniref:tumor necrosis factor ligand superfamily member 8 n=1 Tax=Ambystoma mexicanum TaxID=8296 RepID=UPI0037E9799A